MNKTRTLALTLVLSSIAGVAFAQQAPTRAEVVAQTRAAQSAGCIPHGDLDISACKGGPDDHPAPGLTRAQVRAELAQAVRDGDIPVGDEGHTLAELFPQKYAAQRVRDGESAYAMN